MLSFLPILGPFIQGLIAPLFNGAATILGKYWDSQIASKKLDVDVLKTETQGSVEIIKATEQDWGIRLARDILIWPWAAWGGAIGWDSLIVKTHPDWMLHPVAVPEAVAYMPYAVIVFLLGNIGLHMWKSK